jgi:hypothetical protein
MTTGVSPAHVILSERSESKDLIDLNERSLDCARDDISNARWATSRLVIYCRCEQNHKHEQVPLVSMLAADRVRGTGIGYESSVLAG